MSEPEPIYTELRNDANTGAYYLDWYCSQPPEGTPYQIVREEDGGWRLGHPVRKILAVQVPWADSEAEQLPRIEALERRIEALERRVRDLAAELARRPVIGGGGGYASGGQNIVGNAGGGGGSGSGPATCGPGGGTGTGTTGGPGGGGRG